MAIPEGYRLLTKDDAGKTFGVELEPTFYIDNSVTPLTPSTYIVVDLYANFTNSSYSSVYEPSQIQWVPYSSSFSIYFYDSNSDGYRLYSNSSWNSSIDFSQPFNMVGSAEYPIYIDDNFTDSLNNFLYVKDVSDPYNIKLTEPKLTIHCEEQTMKKDIVVQVDVYDGTVEGGEVESGGGSTEEETGYTLTLQQFTYSSSYTYGPFGDTTGRYQYSINGGEFQDFGSSPLTISNVKSVVFKYEDVDGSYSTFKVQDTNSNVYAKELIIRGSYTIYTELGLALTEDTTLYVGATSLTAGGGAN